MTLFGDTMKICIIGKSKRFEILKDNLKDKGYDVFTVASGDMLPDKIEADYVLLPIPTITRNGKLNLDNCPDGFTAEHLLEKIGSRSTIITCNYTNPSYKTVDINKREDFAYLNAVPTAEGAIHAAVSDCEYSLFYGKILITGFGRVAKILADRLKGLKCNVTIAARSLKDLSYAKALGFDTVNIQNLSDTIADYELIFQTVPCLILCDKVIDRMRADTVVIELSSKSAGTDCLYAEQRDIKVIHAQALPEKVAPVTAGNILTESVLSIIAEGETNG